MVDTCGEQPTVTEGTVMAREYEPNIDDDRVVDFGDEGEPAAPPPTLDPDERFEDRDDDIAPLDDDREETVW
ncbi:hypothetical protein [Glaciihabitans tibetensis]|nr:hypothetical protein [Glaciihabitans tibetensis]